MRKRNLVVVTAVALCAILAGGALLASNMGFKLNFSLTNAASGGAGDIGKNSIALPYFPQTGLTNALQLMQDIDGTGGGVITAVANVQRYNKTNNTFSTYTGRAGSPTPAAYVLTAGVGYFTVMNTDRNYIIVGSHDPALSTTLTKSLTGGAADIGKNLYAPPYNITSTNALQLMQDVDGSGGGVIAKVANIQRYNRTNNTFSTYTGRAGSPTPAAYVLTPGIAYFVVMNTTTPYIASHY